MITIYTLVDELGKRRYVGATYQPKTRMAYWKKRQPDLRFVVLSKCSAKSAQWIEAALIKQGQDEGECDLNKRIVGRSPEFKSTYGEDGALQIRLTQENETHLKILMDLYKQLCPEYDLTAVQQFNRLLAGRLKVAISEAEQEFAQGKACTHG